MGADARHDALGKGAVAAENGIEVRHLAKAFQLGLECGFGCKDFWIADQADACYHLGRQNRLDRSLGGVNGPRGRLFQIRGRLNKLILIQELGDVGRPNLVARIAADEAVRVFCPDAVGWPLPLGSDCRHHL